MKFHKVKRALSWLERKRKQVAKGEAVEVVATNPKWPEKRPGCADAVTAAYAHAIAEGCSPDCAALAGFEAGAKFIDTHS